MDEKELQIETPEEQDNEPLLGQISFEELLAEIRLYSAVVMYPVAAL